MRKIIILPSFASSHLLKCSIPNWIDVIEPDIIIINEGLFPEGPENKGHVDEEFRKKWCESEYHVAGFDYKKTLEIILNSNSNGKIIVSGIMNYENSDVNECFLQAISTFPDNEYFSCVPEVGDIIFPIEPDVLFHEDNKEIIQKLISELKPGEGLKCMWRDFLETQYYCEAINEINPKIRRFCYCFDNMENYKTAMDGFMSQSYPSLHYTDKFWIRHYPWFVHDKWKELRYELIWRKDPQYWQNFEVGLKLVKEISENLVRRGDDFYNNPSKILIRPSRTDEARWAKFIDVPHPEAIKSHPNFVK